MIQAGDLCISSCKNWNNSFLSALQQSKGHNPLYSTFFFSFEGCCHNRDKRTWNVNTRTWRRTNLLMKRVCVFEDKKEMENSSREQRRLEKGSVIALTLSSWWVFVPFVCVYTHTHTRSIISIRVQRTAISLISWMCCFHWEYSPPCLLTCDVTAEFHPEREEIKSSLTEI